MVSNAMLSYGIPCDIHVILWYSLLSFMYSQAVSYGIPCYPMVFPNILHVFPCSVLWYPGPHHDQVFPGSIPMVSHDILWYSLISFTYSQVVCPMVSRAPVPHHDQVFPRMTGRPPPGPATMGAKRCNYLWNIFITTPGVLTILTILTTL